MLPCFFQASNEPVDKTISSLLRQITRIETGEQYGDFYGIDKTNAAATKIPRFYPLPLKICTLFSQKPYAVKCFLGTCLRIVNQSRL